MTLCGCGCGNPAPIAPYTHRPRGWVNGQPHKFIHGHNSRGRHVARKNGYRTMRIGGQKVATHREVAERALGHALPKGCRVHHIDENKLNNANGNLVICQDQAYHVLLHSRAEVRRAGGDPNTQRICWDCRELKDFAAFNLNARNATGRSNHCRDCYRRYRRDYDTARRPA